LPVLSPKQVSSLEHVLPIQFTLWSSKKANSLETKVRLGTRISSFDEIEMWVSKIWSLSMSKKINLFFVHQLWCWNFVEFFLNFWFSALFGLFHYTKAKLHSRSSMLHSRSLQIMFIKENLCIQTAKCGWKNSMKYLFRRYIFKLLVKYYLASKLWKLFN
jgi:hypothetical protein